MRIAAGDWELVAAPERGGAILSLTRGGRPVLRPTAPGDDDPFATACFTLLPYANRIADGRFVWDGAAYGIPPNHPGQAHPLHGTGWLRTWQVAEHDGAALAMTHQHPGDRDWPFPFSAAQRLMLTPEGLTATLDITNTGAGSMPVSLGFHPYFDKTGMTMLRFAAGGVWLADAAMLPETHARADALGDWTAGASLLRDDLIDHCYTGWRGEVFMSRDDGDIRMESPDAAALHLFLPPGQPYFCAEPVTAMPDAVNRGAAEGLSPGFNRRVTMRIVSA